MKELILITSHTPNSEREKLLRNLVSGIKNTEYDIMVVSHTPIPNDIMNNVNYFIFDKENPLMYDIKDKMTDFFETSSFVILATETRKYNHGLAFLRLLKLGLTTAKSLKYEKVHFFEYDSLITNYSELQANSNLLDNIGVVCYKPLAFDWPNSPISFNLEKVSKLWFELSDDHYYQFMSDNLKSQLSEEYEMYLINDGGEYNIKDVNILKDNGIDIGLYRDMIKYHWITVVYDLSKDKLVFFGWNQNKIEYNVTIIVNNEFLINKKITPNQWVLDDIKNFNDVNNITIIVNDEIKTILDFNLIDRNLFKEKNCINGK